MTSVHSKIGVILSLHRWFHLDNFGGFYMRKSCNKRRKFSLFQVFIEISRFIYFHTISCFFLQQQQQFSFFLGQFHLHFMSYFCTISFMLLFFGVWRIMNSIKAGCNFQLCALVELGGNWMASFALNTSLSAYAPCVKLLVKLIQIVERNIRKLSATFHALLTIK